MSLRKLERESIERFLLKNRQRIHGQVLDYGAGKQPYRKLVEQTGAEYTPFDDPTFAGSTVTEASAWSPTEDSLGQFDVVVCTQVLQYVDDPEAALLAMRHLLVRGGWLLITGPTNWPVIEDDDKWRFTTHGVAILLLRAGFMNTAVQEREHVSFEGERWALGWQAVGQA